MYRMYKKRGYSTKNKILDSAQFKIVAKRYYEEYFGMRLVR